MSKQDPSSPDQSPARIFIVDDHPILREGLAQLINQQTNIHVCGMAGNAIEALELIQILDPHLAIVDVSLQGSDGIELMKQLKVRFPQLRVLALSMHDEWLYAERALRAGAKGYVMKQEPTEKTMQAIRAVLKGEMYVSEKISARMLRQFVESSRDFQNSPLELLSDRELQLFRLIGQGLGTREIAEQLCLSVKTIETYRAHIMEKLKLKNAAELVKVAAVQRLQGGGVRGKRDAGTRHITMVTIRAYRELKVYQAAMDAAMRVFEITKAFPVEEKYSMVDQMRRCSRSVCANIGEAWRKRRYPAHFASKLTDSESEVEETRVWLELASRCGYITKDVAKEVDADYDKIIGQLVQMITHPGDWTIH